MGIFDDILSDVPGAPIDLKPTWKSSLVQPGLAPRRREMFDDILSDIEKPPAPEEPGLGSKILHGVGTVIGAPAAAIDYVARASAKNIFGLPQPEGATVGSMARAAAGLTPGAGQSPLQPLDPDSYAGRLAGKALEFGVDVGRDPVTWAMGGLGGAVSRGKTAAAAIEAGSRLAPEAIGALAPEAAAAAARAATVGRIAAPVQKGAEAAFLGLMGTGAVEEGKAAIDRFQEEGFTPATAEATLGAGLSTAFALGTGKHLGEKILHPNVLPAPGGVRPTDVPEVSEITPQTPQGLRDMLIERAARGDWDEARPRLEQEYMDAAEQARIRDFQTPDAEADANMQTARAARDYLQERYRQRLVEAGLAPETWAGEVPPGFEEPGEVRSPTEVRADLIEQGLRKLPAQGPEAPLEVPPEAPPVAAALPEVPRLTELEQARTIVEAAGPDLKALVDGMKISPSRARKLLTRLEAERPPEGPPPPPGIPVPAAPPVLAVPTAEPAPMAVPEPSMAPQPPAVAVVPAPEPPVAAAPAPAPPAPVLPPPPSFEEYLQGRTGRGGIPDPNLTKGLRDEYMARYPNADRDQFRPGAGAGAGAGPVQPAFQPPPEPLGADADVSRARAAEEARAKIPDREMVGHLSALADFLESVDLRQAADAMEQSGLRGFGDKKRIIKAIRAGETDPLYGKIRELHREALAEGGRPAPAEAGRLEPTFGTTDVEREDYRTLILDSARSLFGQEGDGIADHTNQTDGSRWIVQRAEGDVRAAARVDTDNVLTDWAAEGATGETPVSGRSGIILRRLLKQGVHVDLDHLSPDMVALLRKHAARPGIVGDQIRRILVDEHPAKGAESTRAAAPPAAPDRPTGPTPESLRGGEAPAGGQPPGRPADLVPAAAAAPAAKEVAPAPVATPPRQTFKDFVQAKIGRWPVKTDGPEYARLKAEFDAATVTWRKGAIIPTRQGIKTAPISEETVPLLEKPTPTGPPTAGEVRALASQYQGRIQRDLLSAAKSLEEGDTETGYQTLRALGERHGPGATKDLAARVPSAPPPKLAPGIVELPAVERDHGGGWKVRREEGRQTWDVIGPDGKIRTTQGSELKAGLALEAARSEEQAHPPPSSEGFGNRPEPQGGPEAGKASPDPPNTKPGTGRLIDTLKARLDDEGIKDNRALIALADEAYGGGRGQGKYTPRDAYDALETAVNQWVLENAPRWIKTGADSNGRFVLNQLRELMKKLPTQTDRTLEQIEFQQFSTPPTQAYAAFRALGLRPDDVVLEPSAGTGSLAVWPKADGAEVHVNEIAPRRVGLLESLGFKPSSVDAEYLNDVLPDDVKPTAILMNPPFSSTGGRVEAHRTEFGAKHVEQALERLQPGGRLVAIVGEGMGFEGGQSRTGKPATGAAFHDWWNKITSKYNVRANLGIPGDEYRKYGTTFGNQILVIDKTGPTPGATFAERLQNIERRRMLTIEDALDALRPIAADRPAPEAHEPAAAGVAPVEEGPLVPDRPGVGGLAPGPRGEAEGGRGGVRAGAGRPEPAAGQPGGEPAPVRPSKPGAGPADREGPVSARPGGPPDDGARQPDVAEPPLTGPAKPVRREAESGGTFVKYIPAKLPREGFKEHPAKIVEAASMAAVDPPDITYRPKLPPEVAREGRLSNVQYEAVAYAGQRHAQMLPDGSRAGYFIGDGTGVGKGREIAGIVLDNHNHGRKKTLWVSVSRDLMKQAGQDLDDVAGKGKVGIRLINDWAPAQDIDAKDGVLFTTYSSLISKGKGKDPLSTEGRMAQVKKWLGPDGVIVFDEAHKAKNAVPEGALGEPTQTGRAVIDLQAGLPDARVVYVSATGATETRNMAYMTRLGLWAPERQKGGIGEMTPAEHAAAAKAREVSGKYAFPGGFGEFQNEIEAGGVGGKEMVSRDLKALGMYNSRSISYEGVEHKERVHVLTPEQRQMYNGGAKAWQVVLQNIDKALELTGGDKRARAKAMQRFWGDHQRFFRQVTTALKMPSVIAEAEEGLKNGESIIISLKGTGESKAAEQVTKANAEGRSLDELDFTPRETIAQMVDAAFPTQLYEEIRHPTDPRRTIRVPVERDGKPVESKEALALKKKVLEGLSDLDLPENPLDQIINHFGAKNVAEMTGRKRRLIRDPKTGKTTYEKRAGDGISADKVSLHEMQQFQDGKKRIAVISRAASMGISLHASLREKNQQRRRQIGAELDWSADAELQTLGRSHRSDQKSAPVFVTVPTDVGGEKRFSSTIARRLADLGALSRGSRDAVGAGEIGKYNFETREGEAALNKVYDTLLKRKHGDGDLEGIDTINALKDMGILKEAEGGGYYVDSVDARDVPRFLNRILALDVERQNPIFEEFSKEFGNAVAKAKESGTFDEGVTDLKGEAVRLKGEPTTIHTDETTGAKTQHYVLEVDKKTEPVPFKRVFDFHERYGTGPKGEDIGAGFIRNKKSGRIAYSSPAGTRTDTKSGATYETVRVVAPREWNAEILKRDEVQGPDAKWESVSIKDAQPLWDQAYDKVPKIQTREHNIISGAILPLWAKLKAGGEERLKVVRSETSEGQRVVGVEIPKSEVAGVLRSLGVGRKLTSPEDIYRATWEQGDNVGLSEGLALRKTKVRGEDRLEVSGAKSARFDQLRDLGLIHEKIDYKDRFFVPSDAEQAVPILKGLLKQYPPVEAAEGPAARLSVGLPTNTPERQADTTKAPVTAAARAEAETYWERIAKNYGEESTPEKVATRLRSLAANTEGGEPFRAAVEAVIADRAPELSRLGAPRAAGQEFLDSPAFEKWKAESRAPGYSEWYKERFPGKPFRPPSGRLEDQFDAEMGALRDAGVKMATGRVASPPSRTEVRAKLEAIFKGQKIENAGPDFGGDFPTRPFLVRTPSGKAIYVEPTGQIGFDISGAAKHGPGTKAALEAGQLRVAGSMQTLGNDAWIKIVDSGKLPHEIGGHVFLDHFASERERAFIEREWTKRSQKEGSERSFDEVFSDDYNDWFNDRQGFRPNVLGKVFERIHAFFLRAAKAFGFETRGGVFREIESGRVFQREGGIRPIPPGARPGEGLATARPGQRGLEGISEDVAAEKSKPKGPEQTSMFGGEMLQGTEARTTEGREAEGPLFKQDEAAAIKADQERQETLPDGAAEPHKFSSTQINLSGPLADRVLSAAAKIPDSILAEDGRETKPHVTVKYGLHGDDVAPVRALLAGEPPIKVRLGKVSIFPAKEGADYDVVKVDVDSPDLHRLNAKIAESLPVTDTHPEYKPHVTLAYVKAGEGKRFVGDRSLEGQTATVGEVAFSDTQGNVHEIKLGGEKPEEPIPEAPKYATAPAEPPLVPERRPRPARERERERPPMGYAKGTEGAERLEPDSVGRPRVEAKVENLRAAQRAAGIDHERLSRDDRQRWKDLDPQVRKRLQTTTDDQLFGKAASGRKLDAVDMLAVDARVRDLHESFEEARQQLNNARAEGRDTGSNEVVLLYDALGRVAAEAARRSHQDVEAGTMAGRALAARARVMERYRSAPETFLRNIFKQIEGVTEEEAAGLLRVSVEDPNVLTDALWRAMKPGKLSRWLELWKAGLISGPGTQVANVFGNIGEHVFRLGETATASAIDALANRSNRTRFSGEAAAELSGTFSRLPAAAQRLRVGLWDAIRLKPEPLDLTRNLDYQVGKIRGKTGRFVRIPFRFLASVDQFFKDIGGDAELHKLAYRQARTELGEHATGASIQERAGRIVKEVLDEDGEGHEELIRKVARARQERTFQGEPHELAKSVMQFRANHPWMHVVLPFLQTPANIAHLTLERTPVGFIPWMRARRTLRAAEARGAAPEVLERLRGEAVEALARPLLGTAVLGAFTMHALAGGMTGSGPTDPRQRNLLRETGWQPYSFKVGDKYIPYNRFEPVSSLLGLAADMAEIKDQKKAGDMADKFIGAVVNNGLNKTYLQGLSDALALLHDPGQSASAYLSSLAGSVVPNIVVKALQAVDPTVRDLTASRAGIMGVPEKVAKTIASRVPGLSQTLPAKRTSTGEPVERPGNAVSRFLSPVQISSEKPEAVLERKLVELDLTPGAPARDFTIPNSGGKKVRLTDQDYAVLQEANKIAADYLRRLIATPGFQRKDAEEQRSQVKAIYDKARDLQRKKLTESRDFRRRAMTTLREQRQQAAL